MKTNNQKRTLCIFSFETGDSSCTYYDVPALVYGEVNRASIMEKLKAFGSEDLEYEDIVEESLNALNYKHEPVGIFDKKFSIDGFIVLHY